MKYISDSSAIHLAGSGRGFVPWCLYISEYKCLWNTSNKYPEVHKNMLTCRYTVQYEYAQELLSILQTNHRQSTQEYTDRDY